MAIRLNIKPFFLNELPPELQVVMVHFRLVAAGRQQLQLQLGAARRLVFATLLWHDARAPGLTSRLPTEPLPGCTATVETPT
jgi:hypothetical protein